MLNIVLKIGLIIVLLLCLLEMPYGYYQFVRVISFVVLGYIAYVEYQKSKIAISILYFTGAILFNPLFKVALGKTIWQIIDIVVAGILFVTTIIDMKNKSTATNLQNNKLDKRY